MDHMKNENSGKKKNINNMDGSKKKAAGKKQSKDTDDNCQKKSERVAVGKTTSKDKGRKTSHKNFADTKDKTSGEVAAALEILPQIITDEDTFEEDEMGGALAQAAGDEGDIDDLNYLQRNKETGPEYTLYVKPCNAEIRDALGILHIATRPENYTRFAEQGKASGNDERLDRALSNVYSYIYKHCGFLRPFFYMTRYHQVVTSILLYDTMMKENLSIDDAIAKFGSYSSSELFCILLTYLHNHVRFPMEFFKGVLLYRERFLLYMDGASYDDDIKYELIELYDSCDLSNPSKPSLKEMFTSFIRGYFKEFVKQYGLIKPIIEREHDKVKRKVAKDGCLPTVTDSYVFKDMVAKGNTKKKVCLEQMAFCYDNVQYYGDSTSILVSLGYHYYNQNENHPENISRIGSKLRPFADDSMKLIMDILAKKSCNLRELVKKTQLTRDAVYRTTNLLLEQRILIKNDETNKFSLDKEHLIDLVKLLERYGGDKSEDFNGKA